MELTGLEFVASAVLAGLATLPGCKLGLWRAHPGMVAAAACDQDLLAGGSSLHVPAKAIAKLVSTDFVGLPVRSGSGAGGIRTPDLSAASRTLSQLSYSPQVIFRRPV